MLLKYFQKFFAATLSIFIFALPLFVLAAPTTGGYPTGTGLPTGGYPTGNNSGATTITNPLKSGSIVALVNSLIDLAISIGIPIATLMLVYAGFLYVSASGNTSKISEARKILEDILIGIAIILGAKAILLSIQATIQSL